MTEEESWLYGAAEQIQQIASECEEKMIHWRARIAVHDAAAALHNEADWLINRRKADK